MTTAASVTELARLSRDLKGLHAKPLWELCVPKIRFGNIGGEAHREPAVK